MNFMVDFTQVLGSRVIVYVNDEETEVEGG